MENKFFDFEKPLSLYVHIPFCLSKCDYCAFYSVPCAKVGKTAIHAYAVRISEQIEQTVSAMQVPFYTAFIGGGNPGCLDVQDLVLICSAICKKGRPQEFTVEMNPESLSDRHFLLFEKYLTRLSMGVQTLDDAALRYLGRNSDLKTTLRGISLSQKLRRETGCDLSYDMITCLPSFHNPVGDIENLFDACQDLPGHLSVYSLTLEEGTPFYERMKDNELPTSDCQADILFGVWKYLENKGFEHYEVSNFALPGRRSLHNSVYWDYGQYMGLGVAAHSRAFKNGKVTAIEVRGDCEHEKTVVTPLDRTQALEEFVLMGLRHKTGLDLKRLQSDFNLTLECLTDRIPDGFYVENGHLVPSEKGFMTADAAALAILSH